MFERFTERSRQVVVLAQEEARMLKHHEIGPEHLLLGLLREEEGIGVRVLASLGVTVERVRAEIVRASGTGSHTTVGQLGVTHAAKRVLELALREALALGHNYVGTEHLLLATAREEGTAANTILQKMSLSPERIRKEVIRMLSGRAPAPSTVEGAESYLPRIEVSDALLDGTARSLEELIPEIRNQIGRAADAGDLLVVLASVPEGLAARALAALGVEPDALARAVEEMRQDGHRSAYVPAPELLTEYEETRAAKEAAIESREFERAANLNERERRLAQELFWATSVPPPEALAALRARLGLKEE